MSIPTFLAKAQTRLIFAATLGHQRSLCLAGLTLFVCLSAAYPQAAPQWTCSNDDSNCRSVFIVHNSWHAAIVLRRSELSDRTMPELVDFPSAQFIEFSWGDKDYFPDPASGVFAAIKAALWSGGSVMHLVGFADSVGSFYRGATISELRLSIAAYDRVVGYINETFAREKSLGRARAAPGLFPDSRFYPASRNFSLLRTCNTWVAEALERAGLPISSGLVITAANLHSQVSAFQPAP
jgi:uncharacterized protein (TIGR02117 family)